MNAIIRDYRYLKPSQQEKIKEQIAEIATEAARKQEEADCRLLLEMYIKMVCCMNHDCFGHGEKRLNYFLGSHKRVFARQSKLTTKGEWLAYLDKRMAEIFPKDGFPQDFVDSLLADLEIIDEPEERR